ncbi:F-box protein At3g07870-like [Lycium ferocissimum]|uniref:F-box protein At3g07870-like n=1 Tax=Lycium ferocissimum TaxID=112874 RepID=UPI0028167AF9|nr:F-box protein At3g07870-like [Lycium ferocissimum]
MKHKSPKEELLPVGSSKGLFCLAEVSLHHDLFYINNPILEQYVVLPKALAKAEIFTLGHDETWRNLDVSSIQYYFRSCAITLGGTLHRIVGKYVCTILKTITQISTDLIVGFDIDEERFRTILLPSALENQKKETRLTSVGNCLCIVDYNENIFQIDVRRMKDNGVSESWTKTCIISSTWLKDYSFSSAPPMIGISEDDQDTFLISDLNNHCLISYNLKNNSWSKLEVHRYFFPFAYDPSFVSMKDVFRGSQLRILQI